MSEYFEPEIIKDHYVFNEFVNGGYLQNSQWASYQIITTWSKELKLVSFIIDKDSMMSLFQKGKPIKKTEIETLDTSRQKWILKFHYNRAIRAKNRHLKYLKIYLGLEEIEKKAEPEKYICTAWNYGSELGIYNIGKTKKGEFRISDLPYRCAKYTKVTEIKVKLMEEYNKQLKALLELRQKIFKES